MKWATFICLFLVSFTNSKYLPRRPRHTGPQDTLIEVKEIPLADFGILALVLFSQYAQEATLAEVNKLVEDITELKGKCDADENADPRCKQLLHTLFLDEFCHEEGFAAKHGFTDCCAKADQERNECFLSHKNETPGFIPPFERPEPEEACKAFEENRDLVLALYLHEISRRSPFTNVFTLTSAAEKYDIVLKVCCKEEDKAACFGEKARAVKKEVKGAILEQQVICSIRKQYGHKLLEIVKLAQLSEKFPKANFTTLSKIAHDITHVHEERCHGDTLDSVLDHGNLVEFVCINKDTISTKLGDCCGKKEELERMKCLPNVENDDIPADLPSAIDEFTTKEACQHYAESQSTQVEKLVYEAGRRHPEYSPQLLLRFALTYNNLLNQSCTEEHPENSLAGLRADFEKQVAETQALVNTNCDLQEKLKENFQTVLLVRYTKRAPQLPFDDLYRYSKKMIDVGERCCHLNNNQKFACAEEQAFGVLGAICLQEEHHHINEQIKHCCDGPYALRLSCFGHLGVDPKYTPVPFVPEFHDNLCSGSEEDQNINRKKLLVKLIKHHPTITDEQLETIVSDFFTVKQKCCEAENHEACFEAEGPKLVERSKATLGEH